MNPNRIKALSSILETPATRRHAFHGIGATGLALALSLNGARAARPAPVQTGTARRQATPVSGGGLDALDDLTKDYVAQALWLPEWDESAIPAEILETLASEKNSNAAHGERMKTRIQALIDDPETFTPSYADRYAEFVESIGPMSPHEAYGLSNLLGPDNAKDFPPLPPKADFSFPESHVVDLPMQVGWYFVVGSCTGSNGKEYGVEMMFFRNAILPPAIAEQYGISEVENQVTELHFAVTEAGGEHHRAIPTVIAGTTGLLDFNPAGLGWSMGNNVIESLEPESGHLPLHFKARGVNRGGEAPIDFSVNIVCSSAGEPTLQGVEGCDPCCDGAGTLYYSIPGLRLDPAQSTLTFNGEEIALTDGVFWFDHQWGSSLVSSPKSEVTRAAKNLTPPTIGGWDWFMAQFDDGFQIAGSALHTEENLIYYFQTGDTPPSAMEAPVKGRLMTGDGTVKLVNGTVLVNDWHQSTSTPDPDLYWPTGTWYPNHWTYTFGEDVPEQIRTFSMKPIVEGGQSGFFANGAQYSEGATFVFNEAGEDVGRGFGESVNYADTLDNIVAIAGLEMSPEMESLLQAPQPSRQLQAESLSYVSKHQEELNEVIASCLGI